MIKAFLRAVLTFPLWSIGWVLFGLLYVEAWILDFIEEDS